MNFDLTKPCKDCPFRNDRHGFLTKGRVRDLEKELVRKTFSCHKTLDYDEEYDDWDEDSDEREEAQRNRIADSQHCAGAAILQEKLNQRSDMLQIAQRLGLYDPTKLDMEAPVFDSYDEMEEAQDS